MYLYMHAPCFHSFTMCPSTHLQVQVDSFVPKKFNAYVLLHVTHAKIDAVSIGMVKDQLLNTTFVYVASKPIEHKYFERFKLFPGFLVEPVPTFTTRICVTVVDGVCLVRLSYVFLYQSPVDIKVNIVWQMYDQGLANRRRAYSSRLVGERASPNEFIQIVFENYVRSCGGLRKSHAANLVNGVKYRNILQLRMPGAEILVEMRES